MTPRASPTKLIPNMPMHKEQPPSMSTHKKQSLETPTGSAAVSAHSRHPVFAVHTSGRGGGGGVDGSSGGGGGGRGGGGGGGGGREGDCSSAVASNAGTPMKIESDARAVFVSPGLLSYFLGEKTQGHEANGGNTCNTCNSSGNTCNSSGNTCNSEGGGFLNLDKSWRVFQSTFRAGGKSSEGKEGRVGSGGIGANECDSGGCDSHEVEQSNSAQKQQQIKDSDKRSSATLACSVSLSELSETQEFKVSQERAGPTWCVQQQLKSCVFESWTAATFLCHKNVDTSLGLCEMRAAMHECAVGQRESECSPKAPNTREGSFSSSCYPSTSSSVKN